MAGSTFQLAHLKTAARGQQLHLFTMNIRVCGTIAIREIIIIEGISRTKPEGGLLHGHIISRMTNSAGIELSLAGKRLPAYDIFSRLYLRVVRMKINMVGCRAMTPFAINACNQ